MNTEAAFICLAILTSSFWGSWHCAIMCGPIASVMAKKNSLVSYHLGRGLSYSIIGLLGGYLGSYFLKSEFHFVRIGSGILMAAFLCLLGFQIISGKRSTLGPNIKWIHSYLNGTKSGFVIGLLSVLLPCGWLYSYVLAATATQSATAGALVMILFWAAGLPAMSAFSLVVKQSIRQAPIRHQKVAGFVLVIAGLYSVASFFY